MSVHTVTSALPSHLLLNCSGTACSSCRVGEKWGGESEKRRGGEGRGRVEGSRGGEEGKRRGIGQDSGRGDNDQLQYSHVKHDSRSS